MSIVLLKYVNKLEKEEKNKQKEKCIKDSLLNVRIICNNNSHIK